jgi:hypothetical protein
MEHDHIGHTTTATHMNIDTQGEPHQGCHTVPSSLLLHEPATPTPRRFPEHSFTDGAGAHAGPCHQLATRAKDRQLQLRRRASQGNYAGLAPTEYSANHPLLQNSLPVTGSIGPVVTGKAPVTSNTSLVTCY